MAKYEISDEQIQVILGLCDLGLKNGGVRVMPQINDLMGALGKIKEAKKDK